MKVIILSVTIFIVTLIAYSYYKSTVLCNQNLVSETEKCKKEIENRNQGLDKISKFHTEQLRTQAKNANEFLETKQKEWKDIVDGLTKKYDGDWVLVGSKNRSTYIHIDGNNVTLIEGSELEPVSRAVGAPTMAPTVSNETKGKLYGDSIVFETKAGYQLTGDVYLTPSKQIILTMNMIGVDSSTKSTRTFNKVNYAIGCNKIVLSDDQKGSLHLSEIFVYNEMGEMIPLTSKNVSMANPWDDYPISNIVDKNENTFMHNANVERQMTLTFDKDVYVSIVVIRNRKDCCQTRANGLMLKLFADNLEKYKSYQVKDWSGSDVYENGGINLNNPYGYNYIIFRMPNPEPIISNKFMY